MLGNCIMEWSNEKMIEFLELLQTEPSLWDPRLKSYKNRSVHADAWHRIAQSLSFPTTLEALKKKKDSLMGYYRIHLNKYKKSLKSGAGSNEIYKTNWFAFGIMNSFLQPIYEGDDTLNTEESSQPLPSTPTFPVEFCEANIGDSNQQYGSHRADLHHRPTAGGQQRQPTKLPTELTAAKRQMDEAFDHLKSAAANKSIQNYDEYDHFGLMIASKIRKIYDEDEKESLMNTIQNIVYQVVSCKHNIDTSQYTVPSDSMEPSCSSFTEEEPGFILPHAFKQDTANQETKYNLNQQTTSYPNLTTSTLPRPPKAIFKLSRDGKVQIIANELLNKK